MRSVAAAMAHDGIVWRAALRTNDRHLIYSSGGDAMQEYRIVERTARIVRNLYTRLGGDGHAIEIPNPLSWNQT